MSLKYQLRKEEAEELLEQLKGLQIYFDILKSDLFTEGEVDDHFLGFAIDALVQMRKYLHIVEGD